MYLSTHLVRGRKKLMPRKEIARCKTGDKGPDIGIRKGKRVIWIEAIAPAKGDENHPDKIPELKEGKRILHAAPRRQVELRITGALSKKAEAFRRYREDGIIGEKDSCIVAIAGSQFASVAGTLSLPYAVSALYPFGDEQFIVERKTLKVLAREFTFSDSIPRLVKPEDPIDRTAFHGEQYRDISGIIWSRSSIGNFSALRHDLVYVHNQRAERPIPRGWMRWQEEYYPLPHTNTLQRRRHG
jgi:hypothetical protein